MGELAANCRPDLRDLLGWAEPVEPRHQRGMQACRDAQGRRRNCRDYALSTALILRLQHRLRQLLSKQRNAVGALNDVLPDARGQQFVPDDAVNYGADL